MERGGGWRTPTTTAAVEASVRLPGSKSMTNRALVLGALARDDLRVVAPLRSRDTDLMRAAVATLGADVTVERADGVEEPEIWRVRGGGALRGGGRVDVGNAGTVMRFLPPLAALADGTTVLDGDPRARERPLAELVDALRSLGVDVAAKDGRLPVTVRGRGYVMGGEAAIDASASSQFVSGLLLASPGYVSGVGVQHVSTDGRRVPSLPHIALTVAMLRDRGVLVEHPQPDHWRVEPGPVAGGTLVVEPDLSNAAPFLAAAVVTAGRVTVEGWPLRTLQPGDRLRGLLEQVGARCVLSAAGLTVTGPDRIAALDVDMSGTGELVPVLAAVAAFADGSSRLRGVGHLRGHETDRIAALAKEIGGLGGAVEETEDGLVVTPRPLHGGTFTVHDDHRLVAAAAVLGLRVPGVVVDDPATVGKTFPSFVNLWSQTTGAVVA